MGKYLTFTDELIDMGFRPHPETVIVKVAKDIELHSGGNLSVAPLFDYMVLEHKEPKPALPKDLDDIGDTSISDSLLIYSQRLDNMTYKIISFWRHQIWYYKHDWHFQNSLYHFGKAALITLDERYGFDFDSALESGSLKFTDHNLPLLSGAENYDAEREDEFPAGTYWNAIRMLRFWQLMSIKKPELDLVFPSGKRAKKIAKRTGKAPSPYVEINLNGTQKAYERSDASGGDTSVNALHRVRGHFRRVEAHPFIPDGTYFIRPHLRGNLSKGDVRRDYHVVLPEE